MIFNISYYAYTTEWDCFSNERKKKRKLKYITSIGPFKLIFEHWVECLPYNISIVKIA